MLSLQNDAGATGSSSAEVVVNMLLKTRGDSSSDVARTYDRMWAIWRASTGVAAIVCVAALGKRQVGAPGGWGWKLRRVGRSDVAMTVVL